MYAILDNFAAPNRLPAGKQPGQGAACRPGFAAASPRRCPHSAVVIPVACAFAVGSCRLLRRRDARRRWRAEVKSKSERNSDSEKGSEKGKSSRWAGAVFSDTALDKERRGKAAEDSILVARRNGLQLFEILFGLALGPLASLSYPSLEQLATDIINGSAELCVPPLSSEACGTGVVSQAVQGSFKSIVSLLFGFLLGYTFSDLFARQEQLTKAMYAEVACLTQLLEEAYLHLPPEICLESIRILKRYIAQGFWRNPTLLPAELMARNLRSANDPLQQIYRLLVENKSKIKKDSGSILQTAISLRARQADTYAALQTTVPFAQLALLSFLGALCTLPTFFDVDGKVTVGSQIVYGLLVEVIVIALLVVQDASNSVTGIYSVEKLRAVLLSAVVDAIDSVETELKVQISNSEAAHSDRE